MTTLLEPNPPTAGACCSTDVELPLGHEAAETLARDLKALGDPTRLRLLSLVAAHPEQEACVCDLTEPVGLSQPTVSHHLKILVEAGYLTRTKRGTWAYYRLVRSKINSVGPQLQNALHHQPATA